MFEQRVPFSGYDLQTRRFYNQILFMLELNIVSVQRGLFDVLLCDTHDPYSWLRFVELIPELREALPWMVYREE